MQLQLFTIMVIPTSLMMTMKVELDHCNFFAGHRKLNRAMPICCNQYNPAIVIITHKDHHNLMMMIVIIGS